MKHDNLIFIHKLLKAIADSIIIVFIPLYILKETNDFKMSMAYLIIYSLFVMLFMFVFKKIIQKYGVITMMVHFIPIIVAEGVLSFVPISIYSIIGVAALMALNQAFYSIPLNLIFTFGDKKTNVGKFQIASNIGKLVFTLVSGLILSSTIKNSFLILSISSSIFYILCAIPLIFSYKELKDNYIKYNDNDSINIIKIDPWFKIFHITFGLFQPIMDNVVPLYLYINDLSFQAVTIMIVIVEFMKILVNYLSQKLVSIKKGKLCVIIGFVLFIASLTGMVFVKNKVVLYILSCSCSISFPLTFVVMFRLYCNYLKETNNVFNGMTVRDFDIFLFRPLMYAISYTPLGFYPVFGVGFISCIIMLYSEIRLLKKLNK